MRGVVRCHVGFRNVAGPRHPGAGGSPYAGRCVDAATFRRRRSRRRSGADRWPTWRVGAVRRPGADGARPRSCPEFDGARRRRGPAGPPRIGQPQRRYPNQRVRRHRDPGPSRAARRRFRRRRSRRTYGTAWASDGSSMSGRLRRSRKRARPVSGQRGSRRPSPPPRRPTYGDHCRSRARSRAGDRASHSKKWPTRVRMTRARQEAESGPTSDVSHRTAVYIAPRRGERRAAIAQRENALALVGRIPARSGAAADERARDTGARGLPSTRSSGAPISARPRSS